MGFSEDVASMVGSHAHAKRYLVSTKASYHDKLSPASQQTLLQQVGRVLFPTASRQCALLETHCMTPLDSSFTLHTSKCAYAQELRCTAHGVHVLLLISRSNGCFKP